MLGHGRLEPHDLPCRLTLRSPVRPVSSNPLFRQPIQPAARPNPPRRAWARAGFQLFEGVHVPSKAFAEVVEQELHTPHLSADELRKLFEQLYGDDQAKRKR